MKKALIAIGIAIAIGALVYTKMLIFYELNLPWDWFAGHPVGWVIKWLLLGTAVLVAIGVTSLYRNFKLSKY